MQGCKLVTLFLACVLCACVETDEPNSSYGNSSDRGGEYSYNNSSYNGRYNNNSFNNSGSPNNSVGNNDTVDPDPDPVESYCDRPAPDQQVMLPFNSFQQWCSQWCWAAVSTSIAAYFGSQMTDSLGNQWPARECYLASINAGFLDWNTCCQYNACGYAACDQPVAVDNMDDALGAVGLHGRIAYRALNEEEIRREIANGRPIVTGFQGQTGHVAIITGYTPGTPNIYQLDDPWPYGMGATRFQLTYDQILFGPDGQSPWSATWYNISNRTDGCVEYVNPDCSCEQDNDPIDDPGINNDGSCGDGICEGDEEISCPDDCMDQMECTDPLYPVKCEQGPGCWPPDVNCDSVVFACGGNNFRCKETIARANCCNDFFITCGRGYPYYCPTDDKCYQNESDCPTTACDYRGRSCRIP